MKTPKVDTPKPKAKFNTPKSGLVRKSLGQSSTKSLKKFSVKGKEQALSLVKDDENIVEFKNKTPKNSRMSLPANAFNNTRKSPANLESSKTPNNSKSVAEQSVTPVVAKGKLGKKNSVANVTLKQQNSPEPKLNNFKKTPLSKPTSQSDNASLSVENNSSPTKQNIDEKKEKVPLSLDDSLVNKTPNGKKQNKKISPVKSKVNSPEINLGIQLEQALSPKQGKGKKKKMLKAKLAVQGKVIVNKSSQSNQSETNAETKPKIKRRRHKKNKTEIKNQPSMLKLTNVLNAVNALLKTIEPKKNDLLDTDKFIYLQFNLIKMAGNSKITRVTLPHGLLSDSPEVCLIIPDLKGQRDDAQEAIDHYKEILDQNGITQVRELITFRKLKQDYSQHEERRKLSNKFDIILCDSRLMVIGGVGRKFAGIKMCVNPIKLTSKNLKADFEKSLRKVSIFKFHYGASFSIKCGRIGMQATEIADNIVAIGEFFANNKTLFGDSNNFSTVMVKSAESEAFPVYVSTATPNEVQKPKGEENKVGEIVEDEVTTVQDGTVVVYPSGSVRVKKRKNQENKGVEKQIKKPKTITKEDTHSNAGKLTDNNTADSHSSGHESSDIQDDLDDSEGNAPENESDIEDESDSNDEEDGDLSMEEDEDDLSMEEDEDDLSMEEDKDDQSVDEEEIETAEKAYLQELRIQQDALGKQKNKKSVMKAKEGVKKNVVTPKTKNAAVKGKSEVKGKPEGKGKQIVQQKNNKGNQNNLQKNKNGLSQTKNAAVKGKSEVKGKPEGKGKQIVQQRNKNTIQKGSVGPQTKNNFNKGPAGKNKK